MMSRNLYAALAASTCIVALATPAAAQTRSYDIPASELSTALDAFARQSGAQIVYKVDEVRGKRSKSVRGNLEAGDALRRLLSGSGFEARRDGSGAFAVVQVGNGGSAAATEVGEDQRGLAEILVIGSRSQNVDIRRTEDDAQPYVVFDRKELESSGARNLEEFLRTRLPMNTNPGETRRAVGINGALPNNSSKINLRGLGVNQTLVLVDGRRVPRQIVQGSLGFSQADINGIPLAAIERIEILPSTAGGIYGGGAVGGVINVVRRHDYKGIDIRAGYESDFRGGSQAYRLELVGGFQLGSNTRVSFAASHSETDPLHAGQNGLLERAKRRLHRNDPNGAGSLFSGSTPNIRSQTGAILTLKPAFGGTSLGSNHTFVPIGFAGIDPLNPNSAAGLVANAGNYNFELSDDTNGERRILRNGSRVLSGDINIRHEFSKGLEIFANFTFDDNKGDGRRIASAPNVMPLLLPASAPNNPFQQTVQVFYPAADLERDAKSESQNLGLVGGLIVRLGGDWSGTAEYSWARAKSRYSFTNVGLNQNGVAALTSGTLNVLRDVQAFPLNFSPYEVIGPDTISRSDTTQHLYSARASGSLFSLPGGNAKATLLAEHRREKAPEGEGISQTTPSSRSHFIFPPRAQKVTSGYVELTAPIFSQRNGITLLHQLELQASARYDRYTATVSSPSSYDIAALPAPPNINFTDSRDDAVSYTLAGKWAPISDLTFRLSFSNGFLPPDISQLVPNTPPALFPAIVFTGALGGDSKRGNTPFLGDASGIITLTGGGNPGLGAEKSRSLSVGAVITPSFLPGFRFSADFTRIRKDDEILGVSFLDILANEDIFPGRVIRSAPARRARLARALGRACL